MLKRVALLVAFAMIVTVEVNAGIFGNRGGCPNGQCGMQVYQPVQKVAQAPAKMETKAVATTQPVAPAIEATTTQPQPYVASQPSRRGIFRRWSR